MPETQAIVAIIAGTFTSLGMVLSLFAWVVRITVFKPLADKIDRGNRLLGSPHPRREW